MDGGTGRGGGGGGGVVVVRDELYKGKELILGNIGT